MMQKRLMIARLILQAGLLGCLAGCQMTQEQTEVVTKRYIHRYGVDVPSDEWVEQGQTGQVVEVLQDGVTVTTSYRDGAIEGTVSYSFPHRASIERLEVYADGALQKVQLFFPSGRLREEEEYVNATKSCRSFYENTTLRMVEYYEADRLTEGKYYNLDQAVESEVVSGGGKRTQRDAFGQLLYFDTIEEGALALRTYQHPNGIPRAYIPYSEGKVHGTVRTYMPGGDPQTIENWVNGEQHGLTTYFTEGDCIGEVYYDHGKRVGIEKRFAPESKQLVEEISWVNGERHGPSYSYLQGQKIETWHYRGKKVSKGMYDHLNAPSLR